MGRFKEKRGFTLIELIIAVALLAVAGTVAVRLFVHAHVNNRLAADIDRSVFYGTSWIERIKSSPGDWINGNASALDPAVCELDTCSYIVCYDKDWNPVRGGENRPQEAEYEIYIDLFRMTGSDRLWAIELRTFKIEPYPLDSEPNREIHSLSALVNVTGEVTGP